MKKTFLVLGVFIAITSSLSAQNKVHESDIMYKKTIVRALDLRELQNQPLFSKNREITHFLIEAVKKGIVTPYASDSLTTILTHDEFMERMVMPSSEAPLTDTAEAKIMYPDNWEEMMAKAMQPEYYFARDFYQMEIKEDVIFDKEKSRMIYQIKSLTFFIPADHPSNMRGTQDIVASFDFNDLTKKVFRDNPNAIWFNEQNDAQHKSLADAFELRLFSSYIVKVSNAKDEFLSDVYGGDQQKGIMASQWAAHDLLEYEHHLWEF